MENTRKSVIFNFLHENVFEISGFDCNSCKTLLRPLSNLLHYCLQKSLSIQLIFLSVKKRSRDDRRLELKNYGFVILTSLADAILQHANVFKICELEKLTSALVEKNLSLYKAAVTSATTKKALVHRQPKD